MKLTKWLLANVWIWISKEGKEPRIFLFTWWLNDILSHYFHISLSSIHFTNSFFVGLNTGAYVMSWLIRVQKPPTLLTSLTKWVSKTTLINKVHLLPINNYYTLLWNIFNLQEIYALKVQLEAAKYDVMKYCIGTLVSISAVGIAVLRIFSSEKK